MDGISTLTDLKARLDKEKEKQEGNLTLTAANSAADKLTHFLSTLPRRQILLLSPRIALDAPATTLTVVSDVSEDWAIRGTENKSVHISRITLVFTQENQGVEIQLNTEGTITIGTFLIEVNGTLGDNTQLDFMLKKQSDISLSLTDIADYISNNKLVSYLPIGVTIFNVVPLSELYFSFGFRRTAITRFTFTSDMNAEWSIIENIAALKKVGVTLYTQSYYHQGRGFQELIGGHIHATLYIEQDFNVRLVLQGQNYWKVEIIPTNGNILPGLSTLAGLAGGETLQHTVQNELNNLDVEAISLDYVGIGFNINERTLRSIAMRGHITLEKITFNIQLFLPKFEFYGDLSPNSPIHIRELVTKYFAGANAFPEVNITALGIGAQPKLGQYRLYASITSNWEMKVGDVAIGFKEFDFEITKHTKGVTGFIEGKFDLIDAEFDVIADHPEINAGWQFEGSTYSNEKILIGTLINNINKQFNTDKTIPSSIENITLENLAVSFNTQSRDFTFIGESKFSIDDKQVDITVTIDITHQLDGSFNKHFGGHLTIGTLQFNLTFDQDNTSKAFIATYSHQKGNATQIRELVENVSSDPTLLNLLGSLEIDLKEILFAFTQKTIQNNIEKKFLFGLDISADINLSHLPLVGKEFPKDQTVGVDDLQLLVASKVITQQEVITFNTILKRAGVPELPTQPQSSTTSPTAINRGLNVAAIMKFGNAPPQPLTLPVSPTSPPNPDPNQPPPPPLPNTSPTDNTKWFTLQKTFGPVHFERVGIQYKDAALWFLLDAALSAAGLTLSLDGLSIGSPLSKFDPKFNLKGIGIDYRGSSALEIGGAFLRKVVEKDGKKSEEYNGTAIIKTEKLSISAIGSYTEIEGHPSLFIYATLEQPIGGPAFFFVTGLAAGFGCNRTLKVPSIEQVAQFPLIQAAIAPEPQPNNPTQLLPKLESLKQYIPPATGEIFLAVGIKFTSFKMIDSFALLTVAFGNRFELNILGISTLIAPTPEAGKVVTPLAEVQLALKATFIPDDGILQVQAQLTPTSYLFSRNCHLTGGFAFYTWFGNNTHTGDFILTLGGYHPNYQVPTHYPQVPRLGFNWQVDEHLTLKGDAYYALTPSALMAGGHLQATWESGNLKAWFNAGADFLIAWKPYHYEAHIYVDIGASYTFTFFGTHTITVDVGADLQIWGPEFSGKAQIHLWIISFDVTFGNSASQQPQPIDWNTFKASFLPANEQICSIAVKDGLVTKPTQDKSDLGVINPKHFTLITNSVIPSKQANRGSQSQPLNIGDANTTFGIGSMDIKSNQLNSTHTITIKKDGQLLQEDYFDYIPIYKNAPTGLWGESLKPDLNQDRFINQTLSGFEIRPKKQPEGGHTQAIDRSKLQYETEPLKDAYKWLNFQLFTAETLDDNARRDKIRTTIAQNPTRNNLLTALGFDNQKIEKIKLNPSLADKFLVAPKVGALAG